MEGDFAHPVPGCPTARTAVCHLVPGKVAAIFVGEID